VMLFGCESNPIPVNESPSPSAMTPANGTGSPLSRG
jgi:hypothetical protein